MKINPKSSDSWHLIHISTDTLDTYLPHHTLIPSIHKTNTMKVLFALIFASVLPSLAFGFVSPKVQVPVWGTTTASSSSMIRSSDSVRIYAANPVNIIIAGAPASGKGTQCEIIKKEFGVVHLSTGDMLRAAVAAKTEVGKQAKDFMDSGKLVPDEVIIGVVCRAFILCTFV